MRTTHLNYICNITNINVLDITDINLRSKYAIAGGRIPYFVLDT